MIYSLSLESVMLWVGIALLLAHGFALWQVAQVQKALKAFPRSREWATVLMLAVTIWFCWMVKTMDLGEFSKFRSAVLIGAPLLAVASWIYVPEFLAVRALGMVALMAGEPLLESAWMRPEQGRLILVTLAYVWIIFGIFWVGKPYIMRDHIAWVTATPTRWKAACILGTIAGVAMLICRP